MGQSVVMVCKIAERPNMMYLRYASFISSKKAAMTGCMLLPVGGLVADDTTAELSWVCALLLILRDCLIINTEYMLCSLGRQDGEYR